MKLKPKSTGTILGLMLLGASLSLPSLRAQPVTGQVQVRGLIGLVSYSLPGGAPTALRAGMAIPIGAVIKTDSHAGVDLSFSHGAGVVRLLQNSTLSLDKFIASTNRPGASIELQLNLVEGTMAGFEKAASSASHYQVKVAREIAEISGSKYRISAQGYLVMLEGNAVVVFVPPGAEPVPYELKAPAPVYFSPSEGIRPAPPELVREIVLQTKGKLR